GDDRPQRIYRREVDLPPTGIVEIPGGPNEPAVVRQEPGEKVVFFDLADLDENADAVLHLRLLDHADAFPLDDQAWCVLGIVRKARVLVAGPANPALRYFFEANATRQIADVTFVSADQLKDRAAYLDPARNGEYDLVVFDGCAPANEDEM